MKKIKKVKKNTVKGIKRVKHYTSKKTKIPYFCE